MTREEMNELSIEDIQKKMAAELAEYSAKVKTMNLEDLQKEEESLMDRFKENDEYIKGVKYTLPKEVDFEGRRGSKITKSAKDVKTDIIYFLNSIESDWRTSLGIYQMITFWEANTSNEVPYGVMDSTLRTLGSTVKYKGKRDLERILIINNYLSAAHEDFMKDSVYIQYLSSLHQSIMTQIETLNKEQTPTMEVVSSK